MKLDWWWVVALVVVVYYWTKQRTIEDVQKYQSTITHGLLDAASYPPGAYTMGGVIPASDFPTKTPSPIDKLRAMMDRQMPFKGTIIA